jgi:hypothetical protein
MSGSADERGQVAMIYDQLLHMCYNLKAGKTYGFGETSGTCRCEVFSEAECKGTTRAFVLPWALNVKPKSIYCFPMDR